MKNLEIPLEDEWSDVLGKAIRGLGLSESEMARRSGVSALKISSLLSGALAEEQEGVAADLKDIADIATALGLDGGRLVALARKKYHPGNVALPKGMAMFTSPWHDFQVHSYLLWDEKTRVAAAFDTGSDASEMIDFLAAHQLSLSQVFLTHGHGDHLFDLERLLEKRKAESWIGEREEVPGIATFSAGKEFQVGPFRIETRSTWGHTKGGITFIIHGLEHPVAVVGDALFAGSMGGPLVSYQACLETNRSEILSLPHDTILCPGHGPLTTVALERANNPFFPES